MPKEAVVGGLPASRLALELVEQRRATHVDTISYSLLARGLASGGVRPARVIVPWEGHSWEHALAHGIREHLPDTRLIGYDNVNFSRLALSLYPARSEIGVRPLPDRVVTNGEAFRRILVSEGFPERMVRRGCALRHSYLWERDEPSTIAGLRDDRFEVLVATSIDFAQSVELVEKAVAAFGGDDRYVVRVKCHPAVDAGAVRRFARGSERHRNVAFVETPIPELLSSASVMLYTYSVVAYEALAHEVAPLFVRSEGFLDLDQLEPFPDLRWTGRTPADLRSAVEEIASLSADARRSWSTAAGEAVRQALAPPARACVEAFLD